MLVADSERPVNIETLDSEDRLVQWLNEVIYWAVVDNFLVTEVDLSWSQNGLCGRVQGVQDVHAQVVSELKRATYHDMRLSVTDAHAQARVVIDV